MREGSSVFCFAFALDLALAFAGGVVFRLLGLGGMLVKTRRSLTVGALGWLPLVLKAAAEERKVKSTTIEIQNIFLPP